MPETKTLGAVTFPDELPITARREDIAAAIRDHQVVIVAGETGSGKTTQLPKICLALGRGGDGAMVGHTQPRRIAARTVADRIATELGTAMGEVVGYQVRFTDRTSPATRVKVMTDGILLAEIQHDRDLRRYDTIIIDEAHERSLNIDFLLGYLKRLLPRRPDLKLVITSATIDPQRFSEHFGNAPVIEVSGRMYPVEVRYRPPEPEQDQAESITTAVRELIAEGPGDILVFCSGEREIRDAADALRQVRPRRAVDAFEVLPLFARLSTAEQHRVFTPHTGRRVVLATNVAETSLTVPGIRYVVDTGFARISRFSPRTKVQRLPIEPISQASANQRKGRCGRLEDGICIRLYDEEDFEARPAFTDPEILRTNLASVILSMTALGLGDIAGFPFLQPPDPRSVNAGIQLLEEVGAVTTKPPRRGRGRGHGRDRRTGKEKRRRLTRTGRVLVQLPVDPRLGRMLVEAARNGCLAEVVTITAALSMQDPRERPADHQQQADAMHGRFTDKTSDFAAILNLWRYLQEQQGQLGSSAFRRLCRKEFLNYLRIREWQDLNHQLRRAARQAGLRLNREPAAAEAIHRSLLAGLLSHIGMRDPERRDYLGARGTRFAIFPGSGLFKKPPDFVMAAELVETARLWGRTNAAIDPAWAESAGAHLVKRQYLEPHWEKNRAAVVALEKVTLYGVPLVSDRRVAYGRIDPELSRELFIRHALVQGEWDTRHQFLDDNQKLVEEAEGLEHRARRRGLLVDDEALFDFYDERIPEHVVSGRHFDAWWKKARREHPHRLDFSLDMLVEEDADVDAEEFPRTWRHDEATLPLDYRFEPGADTDGVTIDVPVAMLPRLRPADFSWPVPGLREELVVAMLRALPKPLRVQLVPVPDHARSFLATASPGAEPLETALGRYVHRITGQPVPDGTWDRGRLPPHLRLRFRVHDDAGGTLATGKDLDRLREELADVTDAAVAETGGGIEQDGLTRWDFGDLPRTVTRARAGYDVTGYPALVDRGDTVAIEVLSAPQAQQAAMQAGVRRLAALSVPPPGRRLLEALDNTERIALGASPYPRTAALLEDCWLAAAGEVLAASGGPQWEEAAFTELVARLRDEGERTSAELLHLAAAALAAAHPVQRRLSGRADLALLPALTDMQNQLGGLVYPGFVSDAGVAHLRHYPRYLAAMEARLDQLAADPQADGHTMAQVQTVASAYQAQVDTLTGPPSPQLSNVRWMLEELRVSLWAQRLGTASPVSVQRIRRALDASGPATY